MQPSTRRDTIVELVLSAGRLDVDTLARRVGASRETIRRDLAALDTAGLLRKVHGGAMAPDPTRGVPGREGPFAARLMQNVPAKRRIAAAAAALLVPGDSLFVDTGTTTLLFAEELARIANLTVITNSAAIAAAAARGEGAQVYLLGGTYRRAGQECVGELTLEQVRQFRASHAVLTVGAVSGAGFMDFDLGEAQLARAMVRQAGAVTVLADSTKLDRTGVFEVGPLGIARRLVTDAAPSTLSADLSAAGVEVVLAA